MEHIIQGEGKGSWISATFHHYLIIWVKICRQYRLYAEYDLYKRNPLYCIAIFRSHTFCFKPRYYHTKKGKIPLSIEKLTRKMPQITCIVQRPSTKILFLFFSRKSTLCRKIKMRQETGNKKWFDYLENKMLISFITLICLSFIQ